MSYDPNLIRLPDPTTDLNAPGFTSVSLSNTVLGTSSKLNDGSSISVKFGGSYWTINISYPELYPAEADIILPVLESLSDGFENIYIQLPQYINPKSGAWDLSTPTLRAAGSITITSYNSISINNWSSRGGDLNTGDMLKFSNSNKIYRIKNTSISNNTKHISFTSDIIEPGIMPSASLEPNNILFRVKMSGDFSSQLTSRGVYEAFSVQFEENIR